MKLNIAYPANGTQLCKEIKTKDEQKLYGKKIGEQFDGALINEEFKNCILQINGGNDYQGICMVPNQDTPKRIRLLLRKDDVGYKCRRFGVRVRKTVRGSIISTETQVANLVLVKIDENTLIPGLTDEFKSKTNLPKKIHKLRATLGMAEDDDDINGFLKKIFVENGQSEDEIPNIKVKGLDREKKKKQYEEYQKQKVARKDKFMKEKAAFEAKYGVTSK